VSDCEATTTNEYRVALGYPAYPGAADFRSLMAAVVHASNRHTIKFIPCVGSETCRGFNFVWVNSLAMAEKCEITHFAMLHADIAAEEYWVDKLIDECGKWSQRRLVMREVMRLPETFDMWDTVRLGVNPDHKPLLVNTGCWVADLRKPEWFELDPQGRTPWYFTFNHEISKDAESGKWTTKAESEDWWFSRQMAARGLKYFATRKVGLEHFGLHGYRNDRDWGNAAADPAHVKPEEAAA